MSKMLPLKSLWLVICLCGLIGLAGCKKEEEQAANPPAMSEPEAPATAGDTIELSYSIFFPPTHIQCITAMDWAKE